MKQTRRFKPVFRTKKETCYPDLIPLRKWLAHREGEEGMGKMGEDGLTKLEEAFLRRNRDVLDTTRMVDRLEEMEQMGEQRLREIIGKLESGPKIVQVKKGDKIELYVLLAALGPHGATGIASTGRKDRSDPSTDAASLRGVEVEVPGLVFGPSPRLPNSSRINHRTPDQRLKSKSKRDRARRDRRDERRERTKQAREAKVLRQKLQREIWLSEGLEPTEKKKSKRPRSNHGKEEVTPEVLRLLGKSFKAKRKTNTSQESQDKKLQAEKMRRSHKEQEKAGAKWRAGMREEKHEDRTGKVKQERKRKYKSGSDEDQKEQKSFDDQSATFSEDAATFSESLHNTNSHSTSSKADEEPQKTVRKLSSPPPLTDDSDENDEPTLSKSNKEDEEPKNPTRTRIFVKRARRNPPSLTDSSDEDEEPKDSIKSKVFLKRAEKSLPPLTESSSEEDNSEHSTAGCSRSTAFGDLLGGGSWSTGPTQSHEDILTMLDLLRAAIARTEV